MEKKQEKIVHEFWINSSKIWHKSDIFPELFEVLKICKKALVLNFLLELISSREISLKNNNQYAFSNKFQLLKKLKLYMENVTIINYIWTLFKINEQYLSWFFSQ